MAENGPPKGPENTFKASHMESEEFQALAVALAGSPTAASEVEKVRSTRPSGPGM